MEEQEQEMFECLGIGTQTLLATARAGCKGSEVAGKRLKIAWVWRLAGQGEYLAATDDADARLFGGNGNDQQRLDYHVDVRRIAAGFVQK